MGLCEQLLVPPLYRNRVSLTNITCCSAVAVWFQFGSTKRSKGFLFLDFLTALVQRITPSVDG
jgi:hypothetical protein